MIPYHKQETCWTCGPACIRMFFSSIGIIKSEKQLIKYLKTNKMVGTKESSLVEFARRAGYSYLTGNNSKVNFLSDLLKKGYFIIISFAPLIDDRYPFKKVKEGQISENHLAVVSKIEKGKIYLLDPLYGPREKYEIDQFESMWNQINYYEKTKGWFLAIKLP